MVSAIKSKLQVIMGAFGLPLTLVLLSLISLHHVTEGKIAVFGIGSCPYTPVQNPFDISKYTGRWYEYAKFDNWFEEGLKCVYAQYTPNEDGSVEVVNGGINTDNGRPRTVKAEATVPNPDEPAKLKVKFSIFDFTTQPNYIVVDTNYTEYAVVFSCFEIPASRINIQFLWILTRFKGVAPANLDDIKKTLADNGIETSQLNVMDHSNC